MTSDFVGNYTQDELKEYLLYIQKEYRIQSSIMESKDNEVEYYKRKSNEYIDEIRRQQDRIDILKHKLHKERNKPSWILKIWKKLKRK